MDAQWRLSKETFVSGHSGTTIGDVFETLVGTISLAVVLHRWSLLIPNRLAGPVGRYLAESLALVVPIASVLLMDEGCGRWVLMCAGKCLDSDPPCRNTLRLKSTSPFQQ